VVIDAPLLIETGGHREMDKVIVVVCTEDPADRKTQETKSMSENRPGRCFRLRCLWKKKAALADYV